MKSFNAIEHFHKKIKIKLSKQGNTIYLVYDIDDDLSATHPSSSPHLYEPLPRSRQVYEVYDVRNGLKDENRNSDIDIHTHRN